MPTKSWKNHPKKLHTYGSWKFFFSAAPTAQNSPELHFRFINFSIHPTHVGSLLLDQKPSHLDAKKNKKLALNSVIQTYQILTNDDEVCILSLSRILLAVWNGNMNPDSSLFFWKITHKKCQACELRNLKLKYVHKIKTSKINIQTLSIRWGFILKNRNIICAWTTPKS